MKPKRPRTISPSWEDAVRRGSVGFGGSVALAEELDAERAVSDELAAALSAFADMWDSRDATSHSKAAIAKRVSMRKQVNAALARWSGKESDG